MFGRVIVPTVVSRELQRDATPHAVKAWMAHSPNWIEVQEPATDPGPAPSNLGEGEWHAIVLAQEMSADLLLIDDREGRQEARRRSIPVTGTLGVLDRAAERGLVDFSAAISQLRKTNFYLPSDIVGSLLKRHSGDRGKQS